MGAEIRYTTSLRGITARKMSGFFEGWKTATGVNRHLQMLRGSDKVVLAIEASSGRVVGIINALCDGVNSAFIPMLEVVPEYRRQEIGRELVRRMLEELKDYPCIDLSCEPEKQAFYEKCGMRRSVGMMTREHSRGEEPEEGRKGRKRQASGKKPKSGI
jgi:ribosomal protein S18 acetylase RimI-like enzyme